MKKLSGNRFVERDVPVQSRGRTQQAVASDHGGFYRFASRQFDHQRDDAAVGEVDAVDCVACLEENRLMLQFSGPEVRPQQFEFRGASDANKPLGGRGRHDGVVSYTHSSGWPSLPDGSASTCLGYGARCGSLAYCFSEKCPGVSSGDTFHGGRQVNN
jgi:hypothetical protein